ncbi:lactate/malate family dehydrogenase [Staphylococcus equorum]|uniref:lactate/malate family dehydrogenase n=1 Tax=Staphylococcus equorum TaxID=246432 RepID=UPI0008063CAD|nr:lactate dehydrogenase [Staphylococcus equorum]ANQ65254.1 lactate dehydrogenase [Staphylococcus equorum]
MSKIGIIGLGKVGSQVLTDVQNLNLFSDIVLIDTDTERASGEALDHLHTQGLPNSTHLNIREGNYEDLTDASFIVITASVPTDPNKGDRVLLAKGNRIMIEGVMKQINQVTQDAIVILVSNPVDTITYMSNASQYPSYKIIGTGTSLETSRFKTLIATYYQVDPKNVEAFVIGEHGQHAVPVWSKVRIYGMTLDEFQQLTDTSPIDKTRITSEIDQVSMDVFYKKGWTNVAISKVVNYLIQAIALNQQSIMPLTSISNEYGLNESAFSLPTLVGREGIKQRFEIQLSPTEIAQLKEAHRYIKQTISKVTN